MLETLRAHPQRLRGVAVVDPGLPERDYAALREQGVRGLRINALFAGGPTLQALEEYDAICRSMDWHLQLLPDARALPALAPRLRRLRPTLVVDHMGHPPPRAGVPHPGSEHLPGLCCDGPRVAQSGVPRLRPEGVPYHYHLP